MRSGALFLGGLLVWAADFFLLYAIGSIFLTTTLARILVGLVTAAAAPAALVLVVLAWRRHSAATNPLEQWMTLLSGLMASIAFVAVLWQGLPALLV